MMIKQDASAWLILYVALLSMTASRSACIDWRSNVYNTMLCAASKAGFKDVTCLERLVLQCALRDCSAYVKAFWRSRKRPCFKTMFILVFLSWVELCTEAVTCW